MPGIHGAEGVFAHERKCLFFDLVLWGAEDGDRSVVGEVGVEQGEQPAGVTAAERSQVRILPAHTKISANQIFPFQRLVIASGSTSGVRISTLGWRRVSC